MPISVNTFGQPLPPRRVKLREDQPGGFIGEDGQPVHPGDTVTVSHALAVKLVYTQRAVYVDEADSESPAPTVPATIEHRDPLPVEHRDPVVAETPAFKRSRK